MVLVHSYHFISYMCVCLYVIYIHIYHIMYFTHTHIYIYIYVLDGPGGRWVTSQRHIASRPALELRSAFYSCALLCYTEWRQWCLKGGWSSSQGKNDANPDQGKTGQVARWRPCRTQCGYVLAFSLSRWGLGHRAGWRLHMSASLFPGSCRILPGLVSMATGSQQAALQLEGSRQGKKAWAARGRLKLWGLWESPGSWRSP